MQKFDSVAIKTEEINNIGLIKHRSPPSRRLPLYSTIQDKSNISTAKR